LPCSVMSMCAVDPYTVIAFQPGAREALTTIRIALANLPFPATPDDSIACVIAAIARAGSEGAQLVCFPECYVPGYRGAGHAPPPPERGISDDVGDREPRRHVARGSAIRRGRPPRRRPRPRGSDGPPGLSLEGVATRSSSISGPRLGRVA
jgi:hypothetical protein